MESSNRERPSSRMDASAASHQQVAAHHQDRRRHLKSSGKAGSGRRRRRPSGDHAPFSSSGADARMDASSASQNVMRGGSRATRMDNSSAYSNNGSGSLSHRRESGNNNSSSINLHLSSGMHSSGSMMHNASGSSGMDLSTSAKKHSYNQKLKAAQKLAEEEHAHQTTRQKSATTGRRPTGRRRSSVGASSAATEEGGGHEKGSRSPSNKPHKKRHLSDKYKSIGRVGGGGGRRQSVDSAVGTMDGSSNTNNDASSVRSHSVSPHGERRLRTRDHVIPPRKNSINNNIKKSEKSLTATRLKKAFSADNFTPPAITATTTPGGRAGNKSPARGVRRQISLQNTHTKGPPSRRMVERKVSATGSIVSTGGGNTTNKASRRSSLPSPNEGSSREDNSSGLMRKQQQQQQQKQQQQQHRRQRHPQDIASKTTWNTPKLKSKLEASMDVPSVLDSSMPSLTALDLSVHTSGKRASDGCSVFTSTTTDTGDVTTPTFTDDNHPLSKAPSISLLVDNAQTHSAIATRTTGNNNDGDEAEDLEEASTICDSVGDNYKSATSNVHNNATPDDKHRTDKSHTKLGDLTKSDQSNDRIMRDMSRSDNSNNSRLDDSRMEGSRMDGSRMTSSRRRARSNDDVVPRRRRHSPRERRSRSRGGKNMNRKVDSDRNLRVNSRSRSDERRPQRRATMAAGHISSRDARGNSSSSSLLSRDEFSQIPSASAALQRSKTTTTAVRQKPARPRRQKSASSLRRQKSASSIRSANSKTSTARGKSKKNKTKSTLSGSLGQLETTWVRGSAEGEKDMQADATKALSQIAAEGNSNKKGPPRRSMSIGSVSLASQGSAGAAKRKPRMGRSSSAKDVPEQRGSDATWSLADIDLDDALSKQDPDSSTATPPTVSSSSAEEKTDEETSRRKRGVEVRRTQSAGSNNVAGGGKSRRQPSQKSLLSTAEKEQTNNLPADRKSVFSIDPFQDQKNPFETSLHVPFTPNDPFGLSKPHQIQKVHVLGQPKTDEEMTDEDSFHMTNDFGDFGNDNFGESFGSASFDNSQDFAVVPIEEATRAARSLLG